MNCSFPASVSLILCVIPYSFLCASSFLFVSMSSTQTLTQRAVASSAPKAAAPSVPTTSPTGRVPASKPNFTVGDIRRAIPAHCFSRPLSKSFGYLFWDLFLVGVILYASTFIEPLASNERFGTLWGPILRHVLWTMYWICQGCVCTGIWVIGHECGHRGFADSELINDVVGLVVHSFLLVPYFAWQISHRRHHSNTGSVEHDEVFVPRLASSEEIAKAEKNLAHHGHHHEEHEGFIAQTKGTLNRMGFIVIMLTLGWPAYLLANLSGNQSYSPERWVNHFSPNSPIFTTGSAQDKHNQKLILISDVALFGVFAVLYKCVQATSLSYMVYVYFMPYLVVNFWLVLITYLQHTDMALPHYTDGQWDWLRGALATVDRDYGILNVVFHHITDTHVVRKQRNNRNRNVRRLCTHQKRLRASAVCLCMLLILFSHLFWLFRSTICFPTCLTTTLRRPPRLSFRCSRTTTSTTPLRCTRPCGTRGGTAMCSTQTERCRECTGTMRSCSKCLPSKDSLDSAHGGLKSLVSKPIPKGIPNQRGWAESELEKLWEPISLVRNSWSRQLLHTEIGFFAAFQYSNHPTLQPNFDGQEEISNSGSLTKMGSRSYCSEDTLYETRLRASASIIVPLPSRPHLARLSSLLLRRVVLFPVVVFASVAALAARLQ
jgi:omega-6 fatty acid desaturase (delta-12 desaturase)